MMRHRILGVLALVLAVPVAALAQEDPVEQAKASYEKGVIAFREKRFTDAAALFHTAYTAKPIPDFLFNEGVAYEKMGKKQDAIDRYEQYLKVFPNAPDKDKIRARIAGLKGGGTAPQPEQVDTPRGIVYIDSNPSGANVYIDDKLGQPVGTTPWGGSFDGTHKIVIEAKGYRTETDTFECKSGLVVRQKYTLTPEPNLAWIEVRANVPGAKVFLDNHETGAIGGAPYLSNILKGHHIIWVSKDGFVEQKKEIDLEGGKAYKFDFELAAGNFGLFSVIGTNIEGARVLVDDKVVCERAPPCNFQAPAGHHSITIEKDGFKPLVREEEVKPAVQTTLNVTLATKPSKLGVLWDFGFAAVFLAGGIVLGLESNSVHSQIADDIAAGKPPVFPDDSRFGKGKAFAIAADACFGVAAIIGIYGVVNLFLDRGPDSQANPDIRDLRSSTPNVTPVVGPGYAGVAAGFRW